MKLTGKIHHIGETKQVSDKFKKREFVLETTENPHYPQFVLLQLSQDKVDLLNGMGKGSTVECSINVRGREWTSPQGEVKYFNTLECWRIEKREGTPEPVEAVEVTTDDLPF